MLDGLQTEIDNYPGLVGASNKIKMNYINDLPAETEEWVVNPESVLLSINDVYTSYISNDSLANLIAYLATEGNEAMALRFEKATHFDLSNSTVRTLLAVLYAAGVVTETENADLERAGEVLKSRAEELFDRKTTLEDFE